jgi:hypothetical protein
MIEALSKVGAFLLEHADLIDDIVDAIAKGTPKDAIRAAIRAAKVQASDAAFREELGLKG